MCMRLLGLVVLLQQTVDVRGRSAAAAGYAAAAAAVDDVGVTALLYRHRVDRWLRRAQVHLVRPSIWLAALERPDHANSELREPISSRAGTGPGVLQRKGASPDASFQRLPSLRG